MIVLFIAVVLAGCITPFFIEEDNKKDKIISYSVMVGDMILVVILVLTKLAYLPWIGTEENCAVGVGFILLSLLWARIHGIINPKQIGGAPKTHHQKIIEQEQQNNHKAAS